jgi:hypothetical protein
MFLPMGPPYRVPKFDQNDYEIPTLRNLKKIQWGWACVKSLNKWEKLI